MTISRIILWGMTFALDLHDRLTDYFLSRLVAKASTLRENAEESVVGMKRDTDVEAG